MLIREKWPKVLVKSAGIQGGHGHGRDRTVIFTFAFWILKGVYSYTRISRVSLPLKWSFWCRFEHFAALWLKIEQFDHLCLMKNRAILKAKSVQKRLLMVFCNFILVLLSPLTRSPDIWQHLIHSEQFNHLCLMKNRAILKAKSVQKRVVRRLTTSF